MKSIPPWVKVTTRYVHRSFREFRYLVTFGLMPLWLGAVLCFLLGNDVWGYLNGYLVNGEALLISTATIGPLLFMIIASDSALNRGKKLFPFRELYVLMIVIICAVSAALLGLKAANSSFRIAPGALWLTSATFSLLSIVIWFAVIGTNSARESAAPEIMRQDEDDFVESYGGDNAK